MNTEVPFASSAQQLRLIIGKSDVAEIAKHTGIPEQKLKDALAGRVGLDTDEINKLTVGPRAQSLITSTANELRAKLSRSSS